MRTVLLGVCCHIALFFVALSADEQRRIPNPFQQHWPHELVSMDFPPETLGKYSSVIGMGEPRPIQWEATIRDDQPVARAWFIASVVGTTTTDSKGKTRRSKPPKYIDVTFVADAAPTALTMAEAGDHWLIDTGSAQYRIHRYAGEEQAGSLGEFAHWFGGMRVGRDGIWDGKAWFQGAAPVASAQTTVVQRGPVFIDLHVRYKFEAATQHGSVDAVPLAASKRTHFDYAAVQPRETIPAWDQHYEVLLRFVVGDPWAEVVERYRFPAAHATGGAEQKGPQQSGPQQSGPTQYWIRWGEADHVPWSQVLMRPDEFEPLDTAFWVRWYEYDAFGGNDRLHIMPARPRAAQKGRPFALLRPRWNQGPGGAQDFFLTRGGKAQLSVKGERKVLNNGIRQLEKQVSSTQKKIESPNADVSDEEISRLKARLATLQERLHKSQAVLREAGQQADEPTTRTLHQSLAADLGVTLPTGVGYAPEHPAFGVVAAYPSKWVGPYRATISAHVKEKAFGVQVPLTDGAGGGGNDGATADNWYGQRCYALVAGERQQFDATHKLDSLVRRHTDWTLTGLINKYVLAWERDENKIGPHILMSRQRLLQLREDLAAGRDTPEMQVVQEKLPEYERLRAELSEYNALNKQERVQLSKTQQSAVKSARKKLSSSDYKMIALLKGDPVHAPEGPNVSRYFKRYQDDSANPTNYGNRIMVLRRIPPSDLYTVTKPWGGPTAAAVGYIYSDLDAWPGWQNGWSPGNPNFHTDKYIAVLLVAAAMPDHPHAAEWFEFGRRNLSEDMAKVIIAPDGVGWECPGYSGFATGLQIKIARAFSNSGQPNPMVENPLVEKHANWYRKLTTPYDFRIHRRHAAPIGDTHRWDSGLGSGFAKLAVFYKDADPAFASELQGTYQLLKDSGAGLKGLKSLQDVLTQMDSSIPAMDPHEMDWASEDFFGFGSIHRTGFATDQETFLTVRAGHTMGHYHNDTLSYHYYADGTPISLDYNCSYSPRGDHAALHNSMTFGATSTLTHNASGRTVEAMEQVFSGGRLGAFVRGNLAEVSVGERHGAGLSLSPVDPKDAEFQRRYPYRQLDQPIVHRRFVALIKHPAAAALTDYLVIRDETQSTEPQQVNIHLLSAAMQRQGNTFMFTGQYDKDMLVHVAQATDMTAHVRSWHYSDDWMNSPGEIYEWQPNETYADYGLRMQRLLQERGWQSLPGPEWQPQWRSGKTGDAANAAWLQRIRASQGKALVPPPGWRADAPWMYGEYQQWLRLESKPGTPVTWVLYPYQRGAATPNFTTLADGRGVRVTLGDETEEIYLATDSEGMAGQVVVRRNGVEEVLVPHGYLPAQLGAIQDVPLANDRALLAPNE